jgi:hypothetical protein
MSKRTSWITDVFEADGSEEMFAVMVGDAPTCEASATEHVPPGASTALESYWSEAEVVVGIHWLRAFLERLETRVAALEAHLAPPDRTRKCPR